MEEKAKYYKSRAEFAESNRAISSSDPEAITKLREKIAALKSNQQYMKDANKIIRKKISDDEKIELIIKLGVSREVAEKALKPNVVGQIGFAGYKLTNNGATIRAAEKRLALLEEQEEIKFSVKIYDGFMFVVNPFVSRVQFIFDGKPEDSVRNILKGEAFRWSPKANAWQFNLNPRGLYRSEQIIKELTKKNDSE
jgi:methionine synthase II (cobalamin-independent)